jgi:hypothetical protein
VLFLSFLSFFLNKMKMKMKTRFDVVPSLVVRRLRRRPVVTSGGSSGGCDGWRWPRERERTLKRWMTTLLLLTCI